MYLKDDELYVTIGGDIVFTSYSNINPQFILDEEAITGWYDGPGSRRSTVARAGGWGDFAEKSSMGSRVITLTGTARAGNIADLEKLRDRLMGIFSDGGYKELVVASKSGTRCASVGLEGAPSWVRKSDTIAVWKLDLYAPDPRIYSLPHGPMPLGGGAPATGLAYPIRYPLYYGNTAAKGQGFIGNAGNTDAWPEFVANGNMPYGFVLHDNNGKTVTFVGPVTLQAPVIVDMGAGTATQNGIDKTSLLTTRGWISIPPNGSLNPGFDPIRVGLAPITGAWCDIIYRDTWI